MYYIASLACRTFYIAYVAFEGLVWPLEMTNKQALITTPRIISMTVGGASLVNFKDPFADADPFVDPGPPRGRERAPPSLPKHRGPLSERVLHDVAVVLFEMGGDKRVGGREGETDGL